MSSRSRSSASRTRSRRSARRARRTTCRSCCGRPTASCSASTATPPDERPRGARSRPPCLTRPTTRRCRSCSCRPSTIPTAMSRDRARSVPRRGAGCDYRCPNTWSREVARTSELASAEGRAKALFDARPLVKALPVGALRMQIVRALAGLTGAAVEEILESFQIKTRMSPDERDPPRRAQAAAGVGPARARRADQVSDTSHSLSASDLETLEEGAGDSRDLIMEIVKAAKAAGHDVDFLACRMRCASRPTATSTKADAGGC